MTYQEDLRSRLKELDKKIETAVSNVKANTSHENIQTLNNLRADKAIIQSRIDNHGKTVYSEQMTLPKNV